jgi:hypothetical protein
MPLGMSFEYFFEILRAAGVMGAIATLKNVHEMHRIRTYRRQSYGKEKPAVAKAMAGESGEGGIRTWSSSEFIFNVLARVGLVWAPNFPPRFLAMN